MALQIANAKVVDKINRLARLTGLSKTAAVENAVDRLLAETPAGKTASGSRMERLLEQLAHIPDAGSAADPLDWDEHGLPR